jgi:hypothetical protein
MTTTTTTHRCQGGPPCESTDTCQWLIFDSDDDTSAGKGGRRSWLCPACWHFIKVVTTLFPVGHDGYGWPSFQSSVPAFAEGAADPAWLSEDNVTYLGGDPEPGLWQFSVPMQILVEAADKDQALDRAMQWRDAIGMSAHTHDSELAAKGFRVVCDALNRLDFRWHLHHPHGC